MKTRGVLFDLYGTLAVYGEMDKAWSAWYEVIFGLFSANGMTLSQTEFRPYCGGFFERPEPLDTENNELSVVERRLQRLAGEVRVAIPRAAARQAIEKSIDVWHDYVYLDPEAREVLREIGGNRSIALVSNFDYAPYVHRLMVDWKIDSLFDTILVSDAIGVKKPHPGIFNHALRALALQPEETVHVGDSREDIEGAASAGIRPVWIDRQRKDRWRAQPEAGVTRIGALTELLGVLD